MNVGDGAVRLDEQIIKRFVAPLFALLFVVGLGSVCFYLLGDGRWPLSECLYMAVITLTTVGFGETLPGFSEVEYARAFTMIYLVFGMGTFLYFASSVTALIIEGDLARAVQRRRMSKRAKKMKDHFIVCGVGSTGRHVMEELIKAGKECIAVDIDDERLAELSSQYQEGTFDFVVGDATEDETLAAANCEGAAGVVAALADDKDNLYLTVAVRSFNPHTRIIARGSDLSVLDKLRRAGAHAVVSPNVIGGMRIASELLRPHVVRFLDDMLRDEDNVRIEEVLVPTGSPLVGQCLGEAKIRSDLDLGVVAVLDARGSSYIYNPDAKFEIEERMTLVVLGPMKGVIALRERAGAP